jgi:glycosyltransferase
MEYPLLEKIKQDFPLCRTIYTIHYQKWCFTLKGNTSRFKHIIHKRKDEINTEEARKTLEIYEAEKKMYALADQIICLSEYTRQLLVAEYRISPSKIVKIYNGLNDEAILLTEPDKTGLKKQLGFAGTEKIILFVGRLEENQGADILLRAFSRIVTEYSGCRLVIAGDGEPATQYMQEVKDCWGKVVFTGRLAKNDLYKFYQVAELGVIPSMHEQCSYVAMEMMMFGIPIIATAVRGLNEMISDGVNGWKIPVVENEETVEIRADLLTEKIIGALSGKQLSDKNKIREAYERNYTITQMKEHYTRLYLP